MSSSTFAVSYTVPSGPFQGVSSLPGEVVTKFDENTGREYSNWDTHARTRHFLSIFSPTDGWRVVVSQEGLGLLMEDQSVVLVDGSYAQNPAWLFTASLLDSNNVLVANASVVQLINCPMAIEIGQTRARSKLYQALGLPSSPTMDDESNPLAPTQPASRSTAPKVVPVKDVAPAQAPEEAVVADPAPLTAAAESDNAEAVSQDDDNSALAPAADDIVADHEIDADPGVQSVSVLPDSLPVANSEPVAPAPTPARVKAAAPGAIPAGLSRQIEIRARKANVQVPQLQTLEQAQAFLAQLINPAARDLVSGGE